MKTSFLPVVQLQNNHDLENMIEQEHHRIKLQAYTLGKNNGMKDIALPLAKGDKLIHFISGIKGSYEQVALRMLQNILPASHLPEGRIEADHADIHNKRLIEEIAKLNKKLNLLRAELGDRNHSDIHSKMRNAKLVCVGLFVGETVINTAAFEILGDNLLFCLLLSGSVAFAVSLGAHIAGRKYKDAKTKQEKNMVLIISAIGIIIVSGVIAVLRSLFFKKMGVDINPFFLAVFNIAFFLVAALATWYMHPSKEEIEINEEVSKLCQRIEILKKDKKQKEEDVIQHEQVTKEKLKHNLRSLVYSDYSIERIRKLYKESVGEFKSANLLCRHDVPDCFNDAIPELEIPHITFSKTVNKFKHHENDFNNSAS